MPLLGTETRLLDASVARAEEAVREESWRDVPVAAPRIGVISVGVEARTNAPVPVEEVMEMFGVAPPVDRRGAEAVTEFTPGTLLLIMIEQSSAPPPVLQHIYCVTHTLLLNYKSESTVIKSLGCTGSVH